MAAMKLVGAKERQGADDEFCRRVIVFDKKVEISECVRTRLAVR